MSTRELSEILRSRERLEDVGLTSDDSDVTAGNGDVRKGPGGNFYYPVEIESKALPNVDIPDDVELKHGRCGVACCKPQWTEKVATLPLFVLSYGIAGIWMVTTSSLLGSQITSIERHLGLTSSKTGLILSGNDIGYLVAVLFGSHFGKYTHIPRCLSMSGLMFGVVTMAMALGKLADNRVNTRKFLQINQSDTDDSAHTSQFLCTLGSELDVTVTAAPTEPVSPAPFIQESLSWGFWLLFFCALIGGCCKSFRIPILTHYVENNVEDKSKTGLMMGTSFTAMVFGPPIAMLLGSYISTLPVNLNKTNLTLQDQRWVGAWWLGFLIVGAASFLFCLPIGCFPRQMLFLPESTNEKSPRGEVEENAALSAKKKILDLPRSICRVLCRPLFVIALISACVQSFAFGGFFLFGQKYMENQFNKTSKDISMATGVTLIFSLALGTFCGGFLSTKLKLSLRGCVIMSLIIFVVTFALDILQLVFGCENRPIVGLEGYRPDNSTADCVCDPSAILLSCGSDGRDYLSPCLAGCTNSSSATLFSACMSSQSSQLMAGLCELDCPFFIPYMVIYFAGSLIGCISIIPNYLILVRSVEDRDQSLAAGLSSFCQTLLGFLPSPIVYGKIIDSVCKIWHPSAGYCVFHDREMFRYQFMGLNMVLRAVSFPLLGAMLWLLRRKRLRPSKEGEQLEKLNRPT